jgi:hypothetical protein
LVAAACAGPRTKWLTEEHPAPLPPGTHVDVYVGTLSPPFQPIAIIETDAVAEETDATRDAQLEELRNKARRVGANAIQNVEILKKRIKGMTPDEKVPFKAWKQGQYNLIFMRGMAIKIAERAPRTPERRGARRRLGGLETAPFRRLCRRKRTEPPRHD